MSAPEAAVVPQPCTPLPTEPQLRRGQGPGCRAAAFPRGAVAMGAAGSQGAVPKRKAV